MPNHVGIIAASWCLRMPAQGNFYSLGTCNKCVVLLKPCFPNATRRGETLFDRNTFVRFQPCCSFFKTLSPLTIRRMLLCPCAFDALCSVEFFLCKHLFM